MSTASNEEIRQHYLGARLLGRYAIEAVDRVRFWQVHEAEFAGHFTSELMFDEDALTEPARRERRQRLRALEAAPAIDDAWLIRDGERCVAMFRGEQLVRARYMMHQSVVHPDYRRRGIYTALVQHVLDYTRDLGFGSVVSNHSPCNNSVIIAKLKLGFHAVSLDVSAIEGVNIWLQYFHSPELLRAFELRCRGLGVTKALYEGSMGAMAELAQEIDAARRGASEG